MNKKMLLATAVSVLVAGSAYAADPKVVIGGNITATAGLVNEDLDTGKRGHAFQNDAEIHVTVSGKSDSGLGYGAVIELEADVSADADGQGVNSDKTYVYLNGDWGQLELGSNTDAGRRMKVDASSLAYAGGGIANRFRQFITVPTGAGFISHPELPTGHSEATALSPGSLEDATKLSYISPRFSGLQVGVSYTPDQGEVGQTATRSETTGDYENVINAGINYMADYDGIGVNAGISGEFGDAELATTEDLSAWNAGLNLSMGDFTLGGSYGDWGESQLAAGSTTDSDYWTLGAGYDYGMGGVSVTYIDSSYTTNDFTNLSFSAEYHLAPGLTPFAELSIYDFDAAGTVSDNDGNILLVGTALNF